MKQMTAAEKEAYKEAKRSELDRYSKKLAEGVAEIRTSEGYKKLLRFAGNFHSYSTGNIILIGQQNPEATLVNSFTNWKKAGRYVKKGETGLRILAPIKVKVKDEEDNETGEIRLAGFKMVSVFDVSQTDGEDLPSAFLDRIVNELDGTVENFAAVRSAVLSATTFTCSYGELSDDANGVCRPLEGEIVLRKGMSQLQELKTLIHEVAHSIMHGADCKKSSGEREIEAESAAYMVCAHMGLDVSDFSFGYVTGWAGQYTDKEYVAIIDDMKQTAAKIIGAVDAALKETGKAEAAA